MTFLPPATKLGQGYAFTGVHRGGGGGRAWSGGVRGWEVGVVHGWGDVWLGGVHGWEACMAGGRACHACPPDRYYGYGIRSMSGRYVSYWNAFLFLNTSASHSLAHGFVFVRCWRYRGGGGHAGTGYLHGSTTSCGIQNHRDRPSARHLHRRRPHHHKGTKTSHCSSLGVK